MATKQRVETVTLVSLGDVGEKTDCIDYNNFIQRIKKFTGKSSLKY
jgi:hypothetical protein